jgi:hypothetical protein
MGDEPKYTEWDKRMRQLKEVEREERSISEELRKIREQDKRNWEYENGGRNPLDSDTLPYDREDQEMLEEMGRTDMENEKLKNQTSDDSLLPIGFMLCCVVIFLAAYNKYFG